MCTDTRNAQIHSNRYSREDIALPGRQRSFTLLEVLVAVAIFAIVGTMAMTGYNELVKQSEIVEASAARTRAVQSAMHRMAQDFATLEPRPVREALGDSVEPALLAASGSDTLVELTHSGWTNPAGLPRSTLQRVAYRLQDGKLRRDYWTVLDRTLTAEPASAIVLEDVRAVGLRFLDASDAWQDQWPPATTGRATLDALRARPLAVEITLELEDWGTLVRLVEVAG